MPIRRVESEAVYLALGAAALGAGYGVIVSLAASSLTLADDDPFAVWSAIGAGSIAAVASAGGYWRARGLPGQEWRRTLPWWKTTANSISVVVAHAALAFLLVYALYRLLAIGYIGLPVILFWSVVLMAATVGVACYAVYLSVSHMTTQRMASLFMAFMVIGTVIAMVTSPDPEWFAVHFSHLGMFDALSSRIFNGTLIAGGLLLTTFAVYIANDMGALARAGSLTNRHGPRVVPALFVVLGVLLAFVGIIPVHIQLLAHNLSASGMAAVYFVLLASGPILLRGMPRPYFVVSWAFLAATLVSLVLFVPAIGFFSLTAFEITVFALVLGWIAVFVRFLGVAGRR